MAATWRLNLFALLPWIAAFGKFGLQVLQQYLAARVWIHLSNQIHAKI